MVSPAYNSSSSGTSRILPHPSHRLCLDAGGAALHTELGFPTAKKFCEEIVERLIISLRPSVIDVDRLLQFRNDLFERLLGFSRSISSRPEEFVALFRLCEFTDHRIAVAQARVLYLDFESLDLAATFLLSIAIFRQCTFGIAFCPMRAPRRRRA